MKVCLSSRQTPKYLQKADEIKVAYRDRDSIFDLVEKYPDKTIILDCMNHQGDILDWHVIERYNKLARNQFIVCVSTIDDLQQANVCRIKHYFGYPISSFWELESISTHYNVEYILLDMELFFQLDKVKTYNIPIRAVPNLAYNDILRHDNGLLGQWIRPEDLESVYGEYISAVEFEDCNLEKEQAMYRIYFEEKEWRQELQFIITNLNIKGVNRLISSNVSRSRTNCAQKCLKGGHCHICQNAFMIAEAEDKLRQYGEHFHL